MFCYEWDNGEVLSAQGNEVSCTAKERDPHVLLRPVYINAVEVGHAFSQCDRDRRLNVRGVTIALWYFISRGHQTLALLPYCFKSYADKCTSYTELMALFKMNLIEFTPGFGYDKYVEVNRIMATRADETGACIVARSQMHNIVDERPSLNKIVERRLLMPSFNGNDVIFPIDGPLGRIGPNLQKTLECPVSDSDWGRVSHHQLNLRDQRIWLQRLSCIIPEQLSWSALHQVVNDFQPTTPLTEIALPPRPSQLSHTKNCPPETNPVDGKGYSYTRAAIRRANPESYHNHNLSPYGNVPIMTYSDALGLAPVFDVAEDYACHDRDVPFVPEYMRTKAEHTRMGPRFTETAEPLPNFLGNAGSIYRLKGTVDAPKNKNLEMQKDEDEQLELTKKLALIFGWEKAVKVVAQHREIRNLSLLVEFALNDPEGEMSSQEVNGDSGNNGDESVEQPSNEEVPSPPCADLIDFCSSSQPNETPPPAASVSKSPPVAQVTSLLD